MKTTEFRKYAHLMADWMADYYESIENYPVKSLINPGDILNQIPVHPPALGESMETIFKDFTEIIIPGMTHWQNPNFFAYFPANSSYPSVLAEMATAALGAQCMVWETSPAATELEERVMCWLRDMTGLPASFTGVIQDTASTSTLVALLSAREKVTDWEINRSGFKGTAYKVYCSSEAHSSVDKAVKIAGIGLSNLVKIPVLDDLSMDPEALESAIIKDMEAGCIPVCVVAAIGTTGTAAIDPLEAIAAICVKLNVWLHVDAAYAGSAMVLPVWRKYLRGIEYADSYVFNPHKWMFTNFDCSAYFVKDRHTLIRTFEILPEYLKTRPDRQVKNYRDWGIQLGRRFRALKLWFVIREMGVEGIQNRISDHISWAGELADRIRQTPGFIVHEPVNLGLVCFRIQIMGNPVKEVQNMINMEFLGKLNSSGKIYLSHTKIKGEVFLRMQIGQTWTTRDHVLTAWNFIRESSTQYIKENGKMDT